MENKKLVSLATLTILIVSTITVLNIGSIPSVSSSTPDTITYWVQSNVNRSGLTEASPFGNITWALSHCDANDIIKVKPGTYNYTTGETFPLNVTYTNVTIISTGGAANTIINATGSTGISTCVFNITANNATIGAAGGGFTIAARATGTMSATSQVAHVIDVSANYSTIQGNTIWGYNSNTACIHIANATSSSGMDIASPGHLIENNTFRTTRAGEGWGIYAENLSSSVIQDNLWYGDNQTFKDDTHLLIDGAPGTCINIADANHVNITGNTAYNVKYAWLTFKAMYPRNTTDYNIVEDSRNATISDILVTNNTVHDCGRAVGFMGGSTNGGAGFSASTANLTIGANVNIGSWGNTPNTFYNDGDEILISPNYTRATVAQLGCVFGVDNLNINNNNFNGSAVKSWWATDSHYTPTKGYGVWNGQSTTVNATLNWWGNASGPGYTGGVGGLGTGDDVSDPTYVQYIPWLDAAPSTGVSTTPFSITPTATKGSVTKWFNITVQNIGSPASVDYVNVTYPSSFSLVTYSYPTGWTQSHDMTGKTVNFIATGGYGLDAGDTCRFDFQMTTSAGSGDFKILCRNLLGGTGYQNLTISVDSTAPGALVVTAPTVTYYSVGAGNKIWINGTITDETYATPSVAINDTTYFPLNPQIGPTYNASAASYTWYFSYYNSSAVPNGYLTVNLTGTDAAGNVKTPATVASTTIDNTAPSLISFVVMDDKIGNLTAVGNMFYMSANAAGLNFTVTFAEAHACTNTTYISNGTSTTTIQFTNSTWFYAAAPWYNVTGVNTVTINNITITDAAQPNNNTLVTSSYTIVRDVILPTVPTFTATPISGGLLIKNLNSTDNVGVLKYQVYVNGTQFLEVNVTHLANTTILGWVDDALNASCAFNGALVLNLTNYAGNHANLTIRAVDVGGNIGNFSTPTVYTIPEGQWCPIELQPNWNLIGLPLIPADTSRAAVLSLILKQGASGVIVYGYDGTTFTLNPTTMVDGNGYWIYMAAYDVMIVSGRVSSAPPGLPPNYDLISGWNLAGYKSVITHTVTSYLLSLPGASYFAYVYVWDSSAQTWLMKSGSGTLSTGQGFWIWMYTDQTLIPPIP